MTTLFSDMLNMHKVSRHTKYLGLPLVVRQNKSEVYRSLEDKIEAKIMDWKNIALSWNGKETLIKACPQAMPIYSMSCFRIPKGICDNLTSLTLNFWWNNGKSERRIHWIDRQTLQKDKNTGCIGFRCFECMNQALLMKQLWRFTKMPDLLVSKVVRKKYLCNRGLLEYKSKCSDSFMWKSFCSTSYIFKSGLEQDQRSGELLWKSTSSGTFSVKSAYNICWQ